MIRFEEIRSQWDRGAIDGGVVFSPVEEIYDRFDPSFTDSEVYRQSRDRVHSYLLDVVAREHVYPYFFVWNDFPAVPHGFRGIKWHRHSNEPVYRYEAEGCQRILDEICARRLPIVLEEEFRLTLQFVERIAGRTVVIIPHMGGLNGGYERLRSSGIFALENVWADTALAHSAEITDFADRYGVEKLLFGSDYPFGLPAEEKLKVEGLFTGADRKAVLSGNLLRLLAPSASQEE
jgi:predicted TIM-barrel fold metal-dependent hydrolase